MLQAEIFDPDTNTWTTLAPMQVNRLYHSAALLLPDGRVLSAGGGKEPAIGDHDHRDAEIYSPPYLFNGPRPSITAAPNSVAIGTSFLVQTPNGTNIARASLIRLGSVTHALDQNQRYISLPFSVVAGGVQLTVPSNPNVCPPGHYMLFLVNGSGVPSVAKIIHVAIVPTLTVAPATISAGGQVTATWANIANPTTLDWIGFYASSAAGNGAYIKWQYTAGQASGNMAFTIPQFTSTGSSYELRLFTNDSFTRLATSSSFTVEGTSLTVSPATIFPGGSVTATWANIGIPSATDWIGLYATSGAANNAFLKYQYTNGQASGTLPFIIPTGTATGTTYQLRLFGNNTYTRLATSNSLTVQAPALTASPTTVSAGAPITATWANIPSPTATDWIGLYATSGAANNAFLRYQYINGQASGNVPFNISMGTAPGTTYELRLFSNNTYTRLAASNSFTVQTPALSVTPTTVAPGGSVSATWTNIGSPSATDWIGLYTTSGAANTAFVRYQFTNGQASGNLSFNIPMGTAPGTTYELRLFSNNTYTRLATSNSFTIQGPAPARAVR